MFTIKNKKNSANVKKKSLVTKTREQMTNVQKGNTWYIQTSHHSLST